MTQTQFSKYSTFTVNFPSSWAWEYFNENVKFKFIKLFTHQSMMGNSQDPVRAQHHLSKIKNRSISGKGHCLIFWYLYFNWEKFAFKLAKQLFFCCSCHNSLASPVISLKCKKCMLWGLISQFNNTVTVRDRSFNKNMSFKNKYNLYLQNFNDQMAAFKLKFNLYFFS